MDYESMDKKTLIKILRQKDDILKKLCLEKEKLNYYASTDAMTGVLNRRSGLKLLDKELNLSKINDRDMVVCFIDIDRLKIINDTFGHEEGDKLLISTARILKESIRKTDFVIRMGGDEFLVVFPETTMKEVNKIRRRIYVKIEEVNKNSSKYNLNFSCGFYEYKKEGQSEMTVSDLIKNSDFEMYKKKSNKKEEFGEKCINNIIK